MATATETACQCCDEHEAHPLCDGLCEECAKPDLCAREGCEHSIDADDWTPGDDYGERLCEECQTREEKAQWLRETEDRVRADAEKHGWDMNLGHRAQTGTDYYELSRQAPTDCDDDPDDDPDEWIGCETLKVRIGDHGSCYCREDISLVMLGCESGDDHSYDYFLSRLQTKPGHLED